MIRIEDALSIKANVLILMIIQPLIFVLYLSKLATQTVEKELFSFIDAGAKVHSFAPYPIDHALQNAPDLSSSSDVAIIRKKRNAMNSKVHKQLVMIVVVTGLIFVGMVLYGHSRSGDKKMFLKTVRVTLLVALIGYISEIIFVIFVLKPYKHVVGSEIVQETAEIAFRRQQAMSSM